VGADTFTEEHREKNRPGEQHEPSPIRGKHARHPSEPRLKRVLSWGQHTNKLILASGAIATAVGAVIALVTFVVPKHSDQNTADFISVRPLAAESLSDYLKESTALDQQQRLTAPSAVMSSAGTASPCAKRPNHLCEQTEQIVMTTCTKVNGQPASLQVCAYDIAGLLNGSASALAASLKGAADTQQRGELISVDMRARGLQGQSLNLSWSIFPQNQAHHLSGKWLHSYNAYRLEPTTNDDTGSLEIWVPLPEQPGPYFVRLILTTDGEGLASAESGLFD
jgi:hypothetical protein